MRALFVSSKLQSVLLQQQSFLEKCEAWMDFLTQTEKKLGAEISGNYQSLLEQQRDHEVSGCLYISAYLCDIKGLLLYCLAFSLIACSVLLIHMCACAVVPGRNVQQTADSLLHHK